MRSLYGNEQFNENLNLSTKRLTGWFSSIVLDFWFFLIIYLKSKLC